MFRSLNLSVFVPRKDQCELCIQSNLGTLSEESQRKHTHDKNLAREQKNKDKAEADGDETKSFWTMDLQSVLLCPKSNASSLYYKTKVQVHNMTYHNGNTKEGYCYMWDECNGDLSSNMFAYLDYHHFEQYIKSHPNITHYIIWSDNCSYQNKNVTLSNMFFHLVRTYNVTIDQKYLLTGHTQMECDSMHSTIERNIGRCDFFTPADYAIAFQTARKRPSPYKVQQILYSEPFKLTRAYVSSIRPGRAVGDSTVGELKAIRYCKDAIYYKITHDGDWRLLPQRIALEEVATERLFQVPRAISDRKHSDAMSMIRIMPAHAQQYFVNLPHM